VQRLSGLAILEHKPISPPSVLFASVRRRSTHQASHSTSVIHGRSSTPASPAPTLRPPALKGTRSERSRGRPGFSLQPHSTRAHSKHRDKRAKRGPPTPYSSSCSGSQLSCCCFQPLSNFTPAPAPLLPPRPRRQPGLIRARIASSPSQHDRTTAVHPSVARRPQIPARVRIDPCHLHAHSSRRPVARAQAPRRKHSPCANRKRLLALLLRPRPRVEPSATGA
jgi:hypothetical protein